ncbi:hypothetical protein AB0M46_00650 [Dactylosporangium sp. NPDC051485]|uniref:hypothetical protein n=1 Tax=Dactylosporangium sp. NPDC051485 TaxID=3154846 RepID=UPI003434E138
MTEQPHQPLDHLAEPVPDAEAVTQPLPPPTDLGVGAAAQPLPPPADLGVKAAAQPLLPEPADLDLGAATQPLPPPPPKEHPVHRPPVGLIAALAIGVVVAVAVVIVLLGRIGKEPAAAAETPPQRFPSPQALVEYLDRHGLSCDSYEALDDASDAFGRGRCVAGGATVGVGVYEAHAEVEAEWKTLAGSRDRLFMALGDNWAVDGPADWTRRVAEALNAQYRAQP